MLCKNYLFVSIYTIAIYTFCALTAFCMPTNQYQPTFLATNATFLSLWKLFSFLRILHESPWFDVIQLWTTDFRHYLHHKQFKERLIGSKIFPLSKIYRSKIRNWYVAWCCLQWSLFSTYRNINCYEMDKPELSNNIIMNITSFSSLLSLSRFQLSKWRSLNKMHVRIMTTKTTLTDFKLNCNR